MHEHHHYEESWEVDHAGRLRHAVYTPASLGGPSAMVASPGTQIVAAANTNILRTIHFSTPSSGKTVTFSIGADAAATRILAAYALTANVPAIFNGWWVTTARCDTDINSTAGVVYVAGFTYA